MRNRMIGPLALFLLPFQSVLAQPGTLPNPDFDDPCSYLEDKEYDLNNDGVVDIILYVGSEGTDDVPSSSGVCFYSFSIVNGGYIKRSSEANYNYLLASGDEYERASLDYLSPRDVYLPKLLLTSYPARSEVSWQTHLNGDEVYFPIYVLEKQDTLIGWVKLVIDVDKGYVSIEDAALTAGSGFKTGSDTPARPYFFKSRESGPKVGIGFYDLDNSSDYFDIGINAVYSFRYGFRRDWVSYAHVQSDLGFEVYTFDNELFFAPKIAGILHLLFLDIGLSSMFYTNSGGHIVPRLELGISFNQLQFNIGINLTDPAIDIPLGIIQINYFFPMKMD